MGLKQPDELCVARGGDAVPLVTVRHTNFPGMST